MMSSFYKIYEDLLYTGNLVSPRGLKVLELENYHYRLAPGIRFANFDARKLSLDYIKTEFKWYLKGDSLDLSIIDHAKLWEKMVNTNGEIPSNYGQYIFDSINQFEYVVNTLKNDKDSRRASIGIMNHFHTLSGDYDLPCTYAINFRIRNDELNMTVHMRSQDAILGLGNDAPTFSFIHEMVYNSLLDTYPDLHYGNYDHFVDSLHIYEKHFPMLIEIVRGRKFTPITIPWINGKDEVDFLIKSDFSVIPPEFKFTQWLCE